MMGNFNLFIEAILWRQVVFKEEFLEVVLLRNGNNLLTSITLSLIDQLKHLHHSLFQNKTSQKKNTILKLGSLGSALRLNIMKLLIYIKYIHKAVLPRMRTIQMSHNDLWDVCSIFFF